MFSMTFQLGYAQTIMIFMSVFLALLVVKLSLKGYHPLVYWLTFTASAIAGTALSDFLNRTLQLGYTGGAAILTALLVMTLAAWHLKEHSISVEYIPTFHAEVFYWIAFLMANTLGTAAGDFLADDMGLGFMSSALVLAGLLVIIALLHVLTKVSDVLLFWVAFVLTRPFGATFGDFLTKPIDRGGIHVGTIGSSILFFVILLVAIGKETRLEKRRQEASSWVP